MIKQHQVVSKSAKQTLNFGKQFARLLKGGEHVLLQGELGAGKTTFVQGLALALGVRARVKSPTFALLHQYSTRNQESGIRNFVHADAYRVQHAREFKEIGLTDWFNRPDTVLVVEWGEKIKPLLHGKLSILILLRYGQHINERIIQIIPPQKIFPLLW